MRLMKINIKEANDQFIEFELSDANYEFANALRRIIMTSIPIFAIDTVTFYENSSPMFDEYIAHRIGLIPIKTPKNAKEGEEILFHLEAEGPKTVYSSDLISTDQEVVVANQKIPIIKLGENQRLRLDGKAIIGYAKTHAKFQAAYVTYNAKDDKTFSFYVETFGQMKPKDILVKALDILYDQAAEFAKELK